MTHEASSRRHPDAPNPINDYEEKLKDVKIEIKKNGRRHPIQLLTSESDLQKVAKLEAVSFKKSGVGFDRKKIDALREYGGIILGEKDANGDLIMCVELYPERNPKAPEPLVKELPKKSLYSDVLMVAEEYKGQGFGSVGIAATEVVARFLGKEEIYKTIALKNTDSTRTSLRAGYVGVASMASYYYIDGDLTETDRIVYYKNLDRPIEATESLTLSFTDSIDPHHAGSYSNLTSILMGSVLCSATTEEGTERITLGISAYSTDIKHQFAWIREIEDKRKAKLNSIKHIYPNASAPIEEFFRE